MKSNTTTSVYSTTTLVLATGCVSLLLSALPSAYGQVVQLPTLNTFSMDTSVMVPDRGTMSLGGNGYGAYGSSQRGPLPIGPNYGSTRSAAGVSVSATIIDLNELDRLIRSQANSSQAAVDLSPAKSTVSKFRHTNKGIPTRVPDYAYLMQLSSMDAQPVESSLDDTRYYLSLAEVARQRGQWASVELFYKLAWQSLPPKNQLAARETLAKARAEGDPANASPNTKGNATGTNPNKPTRRP